MVTVQLIVVLDNEWKSLKVTKLEHMCGNVKQRYDWNETFYLIQDVPQHAQTLIRRKQWWKDKRMTWCNQQWWRWMPSSRPCPSADYSLAPGRMWWCIVHLSGHGVLLGNPLLKVRQLKWDFLLLHKGNHQAPWKAELIRNQFYMNSIEA